MAPQAYLDFSAPSTRRDHQLGLSPSSHSLAKPSFGAFRHSPPPADQRRASPIIRIVHIFSPTLIKTDVANFRALVQKLTGNSSCSSVSEAATVTDPLRKIKTEEKRRKKAGKKIDVPAALSTSAEGRSNSTQAHYNSFASMLYSAGDVNRFQSSSMERCISWESPESVDHLVFREVNIELPLFPPLTNISYEENSSLEDQNLSWR